MAKRGPKMIEIDWESFDKLCAMQCTLNEIAAWFDCSIDTIEGRCKKIKGIKFSDYYAKKRVKGLISLRRAQWQAATETRNPAVLIFLGKNYLGQSDKQEAEIKVSQIKIEKQDESL